MPFSSLDYAQIGLKFSATLRGCHQGTRFAEFKNFPSNKFQEAIKIDMFWCDVGCINKIKNQNALKMSFAFF